MIWGWVVGLVFVLFPNQVWRFYRWFLGPDFERRNPYPRQTRNVGIVVLVIMAVITAFTWNKR